MPALQATRPAVRMVWKRVAYRDPDLPRIRRYGDAVKSASAQVLAVRQGDAAHGHDGAILPHAHDRALAAVGDVEIGVARKRRVAGEAGISDFWNGRREIDRRVQLRRREGALMVESKHLVAVAERQCGDGVVLRLGDEQDAVRHPVEDHAGPRDACAAQDAIPRTH